MTGALTNTAAAPTSSYVLIVGAINAMAPVGLIRLPPLSVTELLD